MSPGQATKRAYDLLGQAIKPAESVRLATGRGPKLDIAWGSFHHGMGSCVATLLRRSAVPRKFLPTGFFRDCWVERKIPRRAVVAAALWHFVFLVMPYPRLPAAARHYAAFDNTELTWSGPINDLPLLELSKPNAKPAPRSEPDQPLPPEGADAFHPRQHIFTDAARPTHPRQTLINSAAPPEPPKILPSLPNIVQLQQLSGPARPSLQISQETLAKLRPKERRRATVASAPLPEVPAFQQELGEVSLTVSPNGPARPKVELNTGATPRVAPRAQSGDAEPAPEVNGMQPGATNENASTLIAVSAAPAPPAPVVQVPQGNLAARVSISPEGQQPGAPGGSPKSAPGATGDAAGGPGSGGGTEAGKGSANNDVTVSISGGNPPANNGISGLGGSPKVSAPAPARSGPAPRTLITKPEPRAPLSARSAAQMPAQIEDAPDRTGARTGERPGPPNFAALPPGAQPERIFASKKIYKMVVNMPNLNSATGSWILNFSELRVDSRSDSRLDSIAPRAASPDISGPAPLKKVDPKYPPTLINEHVEGEVVLYAVIRADGSVDSIQLIHGIDEQLDANAMNALSHWKFRPATREGSPIELEAIVHIPFHFRDDR